MCAQLSILGMSKPDGEVDSGDGGESGEVAPAHLAERVAVRHKVGGERAEYAEYRAARAHRDCVSVEHVAERAAGQSRQQVDGGEARVAVHAFDKPAEDEEREAVEEEVYRPGVEEHGGEEAPVFARGDERPEHRAEAQQQVHILIEEAADELH